MLENVPLFFPFAKQSQKAFVTLSWRNTTLGQSSAPASCRLLSMKKATRRNWEWLWDLPCKWIFCYCSFFYLPVINSYLTSWSPGRYFKSSDSDYTITKQSIWNSLLRNGQSVTRQQQCVLIYSNYNIQYARKSNLKKLEKLSVPRQIRKTTKRPLFRCGQKICGNVFPI